MRFLKGMVTDRNNMGRRVSCKYHPILRGRRRGLLSPPGVDAGLESSSRAVVGNRLLIRQVDAIVDYEGASGLDIFFCYVALAH
jgi:hypothetical protein